MIGLLPTPGRLRSLLLAVLAVLLVPAISLAETLYVRNECPIPLVVQTGSVVRGVLRRDPPVTLKNGDITPGTMLPGNKIITIYDARNPNRILYRGTIPAAIQDQQYGITPNGLGGIMLEPRKPFTPR